MGSRWASWHLMGLSDSIECCGRLCSWTLLPKRRPCAPPPARKRVEDGWLILHQPLSLGKSLVAKVPGRGRLCLAVLTACLPFGALVPAALHLVEPY
jgi:hypothetical protein